MPNIELKKTAQSIVIKQPALAVKYQKVAVGVIKNPQGQILISRRAASLPLGGLWEFAGGKFEDRETARQALRRELQEELSIEVITAKPLITLKHHYPDVAVKLHVFLVEQFSGTVCSTLGQACRWVDASELNQYPFLAANKAIITAVQLPEFYAILDDVTDDEAVLMANLEHLLAIGIKLIQARLKRLPPAAVGRFLARAYPLCQQRGTWLLINSAVAQAETYRLDGIHLTRQDLLDCHQRPKRQKWLAASCHSLKELLHAQKIGVDFAVLSPVQATVSHPEAPSLGWQRFTQMVAAVNVPVYGLGGLSADQLGKARQMGGQGIAAIRAFSIESIGR